MGDKTPIKQLLVDFGASTEKTEYVAVGFLYGLGKDGIPKTWTS